MQADVLPLIFIQMDLGGTFKLLLFRSLRLTINDRCNRGFARNLIITGSGGNTLGEFSTVVRHQVPMGGFVACQMDCHPDAVKRAVVRAVGGAKNKAIWFNVVVFSG